MEHPIRRRRAVTALVAALVSAVALGLPAGPSSAQEDEGAPSEEELTPGLPVPDDVGVVHSWGIVPGDGSLEAGERPNLSYELAPGDETQDVATLYNFSNVDLTFRVYTTDAFNRDDGTFDLLPGDEEPADVGSWFELGLDGITVPAGSQATFPFTVRVPADARPGDHAGALLASSSALGTGPDGDTIDLDRRTGTRIYVRVDGPLQPELAVEDLSTSYSSSVNPFGGTAEVSYTIVNRGNVRLAATQRVSVGGPFGLLQTSTDRVEVPELLPGESMEVTRTIDGVAATGLSFTDVDLDPVSLTGGSEDLEPADRRAFSFAIPFSVLAGVVALALVWFARRSYVKHRNESLVIEHQPT